MAIDLDGAVALVTGGAIGGRFACGDVREQADNKAAGSRRRPILQARPD